MGIGSRSTYFYPGVVGGEKPTSPFWRPGQGGRYLPMLLQRRAGTQWSAAVYDRAHKHLFY